jgi:5-hydroxyisourate hydrolase-like protein (transthyretin family)
MRTHYLFLLIVALLLTVFPGQPATADTEACIWKGTAGATWHDHNNWSNCNATIPQPDDDVLIPAAADRAGSYQPVLFEDTTIRSLINYDTIRPPTRYNIPTVPTLTVTGPDFVNSGTMYVITAMRGPSPQTLSGDGIWRQDYAMAANTPGYVIIGTGSVVTLAGTMRMLSGTDQPGLQIETGATLLVPDPQSLSVQGQLIHEGTISGAGPLHLRSFTGNLPRIQFTGQGRIDVPLVLHSGSISFLEAATLEQSVTIIDRNAFLYICRGRTLTVNGASISNGGRISGSCSGDTPEMQGTLVFRGAELLHNGQSIDLLRLVFDGSTSQTLTSAGPNWNWNTTSTTMVVSEGVTLRLMTPLYIGGAGTWLVERGATLDIATHHIRTPEYQQQPGATLRIGLTSNGDELQHGILESPTTSLNGKLDLYLVGDQMPAITDPPGVMRYIWRSGAFAHVAVPPASGLVPVYAANGIDMTPVDQAPGSIAGRVTSMDGAGLAGIQVQTYRQFGSTSWSAMATTTTAADGSYRLENLLAGSYRVQFRDPQGRYRPEYYTDAGTLATADTLTVAGNQATSGIDAGLDLAAAPLAQVDTTRGSVTSDPNDGTVTVAFTRSRREDTTISSSVSCPGNTQPSGVTLWVGERSYPMTVSSADSGIYQATLPESEVTTGALLVRWDCDGTTQEQTIGRIVLYDPSGVITDAQTGQPVVGATVTLHRVPGALPDTRDEQRDCRTIATRQGDSWAGEPAATPGLGLAVNPELAAINGTAEISPTLNPQITNDVGRYGWDVAEGCWYITVVADGYEPTSSPVVGVPEPVTDLDLRLTPTDRTVYLPLVIR